MNTEKNGVTSISSPLLVWLLQNRYICVKRDRKTKKFEPGTRYAFRLSLVDTLTKKIPALSASTKAKNRKNCGARIAHRRCGRSEGIRTPGILLPKQARYQLRYTPVLKCLRLK